MPPEAQLHQDAILRVRDAYQVVPSAAGLPHVRSGSEVVLSPAGKQAWLLGRVLLAVDGHKTVAQLLQELSEVGDQEAVLSATRLLLEENIVELILPHDDTRTCTRSDQDRYFSHYVADPEQSLKRLSQSRCILLGDRNLCRVVAAELRTHGLEDARTVPATAREVGEGDSGPITEEVASGDLVLVLSQAYHPRLCRKLNALCAEELRPVLFADLSSGNHAVIGPLFVPGQSACYACQEARMFANTDNYRQWRDFEASEVVAGKRVCTFGGLTAFLSVTAGLIALEVLAYLSGYRPARTIDGTLIVDFFEPHIYREPVLKWPTCDICRGISAAAFRPSRSTS